MAEDGGGDQPPFGAHPPAHPQPHRTGHRDPGGPGGQQSGACGASHQKPRRAISLTAELKKRHPGDSPLLTLSPTKRRSPLRRTRPRTPREAVWKQLQSSRARKGCGMCWFLTHPISPPYAGDREGEASGLVGILAPASWRGGPGCGRPRKITLECA